MQNDPGAFASYYPTLLRYCAVAAGVALVMYLVYRLLRLAGAKHEAAAGFSLVTPWIIGFLGFVVFPIALSFYLSFTDYNVLWDKPKALEDPLFNYKRALSIKIITLYRHERLSVSALGKLNAAGPETVRYRELDEFTIGDKKYVIAATDVFFLKGLWLSLRYAVLNVPLGLIGALGVALLLNQAIRGVGYWRTLYYLPAVLPAAATALLWFWLFAPTSGLINWLLDPIYKLFNMKPLGWFTDPNLVLPSFVIMGMWGIFGANSVILLAGLKNIPTELYEAASIDGAGNWAKFRRVTIPMLSPALFYLLVTSTIASITIFTQQAFIPTKRE
ncbi:MAG TPA: sugar ABC transporter permease, partial [Aggregatilineaceae bacterium]|nr:sugar ABC transporter permease [Aggregatilineaceae bacterium]